MVWRHLLTVSVSGDIQAPLNLLFQRRGTLKLFKRLTVGYVLYTWNTTRYQTESQSSLAKPTFA